MSIQLSVAARNAALDSFESTAGVSAHLYLYSGAPPANCATADGGTLLCDITLPADYLNNASAGSKTLLGTWSGTGAAAASTGTACGHFRIVDSTGTTCHMQGTVTATGGGGDMTLNNTSIATGQTVQVTTFTMSAANA